MRKKIRKIITFQQVRSSCQNLLLHPLVEGLLNYKWKRYCRYTFYGNFVLFTIFLIMFNVYMLTVPPYYKIDWNAVMENRKIYICSWFIFVYTFPLYLRVFTLIKSFGMHACGLITMCKGKPFFWKTRLKHFHRLSMATFECLIKSQTTARVKIFEEK